MNAFPAPREIIKKATNEGGDWSIVDPERAFVELGLPIKSFVVDVSIVLCVKYIKADHTPAT